MAAMAGCTTRSVIAAMAASALLAPTARVRAEEPPAPKPAADAKAARAVCVGLAEAACRAASACRWINGFRTHDSRQVPGLCRGAPVPAALRRPKPQQ
jgi:hypothetical protein